MSKALDRISKSPFTRKIEGAKLPRRFHQPTFTMYNSRMDPVEHISQFNQRMTVHSKDEDLMCKVFPSSLGPMAMRWFDGLRLYSIDSFKQLTQAFGSCFITSSRVPRPLDSLLSLSMREGETLKAYSDKYWEMYNEIEGNYDDVAINTFKSGLLTEHGLRKSLTGKPVTSRANSWTGSTSIKGLKRTSSWEKVKQRLSLRRGGTSGRIDLITTTDRGETLQGNSDLLTRRQLMLCSEIWYIRFWRKSRMNHSSNGQIRWQETP